MTFMPVLRMRPHILLSLLLLACAPRLILPPVSPSPAWEAALEPEAVRVPDPSAEAPAVRRAFDAAAGWSRTFVTTHAGVYTGWVQKPQLTFFALTRGPEPPTRPPTVLGLVFRTYEPAAVTGPRLTLTCPGQADTIPVAVDSRVAPTGNTQSHFLSYLLPAARVANFARCPEGELMVGKTTVRFSPAQLGGIRALLLAVGAARGEAAGPGS